MSTPRDSAGAGKAGEGCVVVTSLWARPMRGQGIRDISRYLKNAHNKKQIVYGWLDSILQDSGRKKSCQEEQKTCCIYVEKVGEKTK